jgi:Rrf2 family protein
MRLGDGVEWALHCCTVLASLPTGTALPASRLAELHGVPGAYLAKHLQALGRAGILTAVPGPGGGYRLGRAPAGISLLDIVEAVEGGSGSFRCTEIRRRGPAALPDREYKGPCSIASAMYRADEAWRAELRAQSLADLCATVADNINPKAAERAVVWIKGVLR